MSLFLLKVLILLSVCFLESLRYCKTCDFATAKQFLQKLEPHNDDSIEKTDLLALIAVLLFIFFIWRGLSIASRARVAAIPPPPPTTRPPAESELTETTATPTNTPPTPFTPQASLLSPSNEPQAPQQPHTDDEPAEYDDLQARIEASLLSPPTPPPVHTVKDGQRRLRLLSRQKLVREASTEPVTQDNGATSAAQITSKAPVAPTEAPSDVLDSSMTHLETSPLPEQSPVAGRSDPPAPSPDSSIHTTCQTAESIPSSASTGQRPRYKHGWRKIDPSVQGMNWAAQRRRSYPAPLLPLHQKTIQRIQAGKNGPSTSTEAVSSMVDEHINQTEEYNRPEPTPRGSAPRIQPAMSTSSDETGDSVCYETPSEYTNSLGAAEMDSLASDFAMLLINPGTPETPEVSPAHANSVSLTSPESGHGVGVQSVISSTITAPEQVEEQVPQDDEDDYDSDPDGLYYATPPGELAVGGNGGGQSDISQESIGEELSAALNTILQQVDQEGSTLDPPTTPDSPSLRRQEVEDVLPQETPLPNSPSSCVADTLSTANTPTTDSASNLDVTTIASDGPPTTPSHPPSPSRQQHDSPVHDTQSAERPVTTASSLTDPSTSQPTMPDQSSTVSPSPIGVHTPHPSMSLIPVGSTNGQAPSTVHSQGIMDTGTQDEDMVDTPSTNVPNSQPTNQVLPTSSTTTEDTQMGGVEVSNSVPATSHQVATHTQPDTSGPMEGVLNSVPAPQLPPQSTTQLDTSRPMEGVQNSVLERPKPPQSTVNPPSDDSGPMEGIHQSFQVPQHPAQSSVPTQSNEQGDEMDVVQNTIPAPPPPAQAKTTMARNRDIRENFRLTRRAKDDFVSNDSEPKGIVTVEEAIRNAFLNVRSKSTAANSAAAAQGTSPAQTGLAPATSLPTASSTSAPSNIKVTPSASSQGNLQSADVASPSVLKKRSRDAYERPISSQNAQAPRALAPIKRTRPQNGNSEYTDEVALFDEDGVVAVEQTGEAFGPQFCVNSQVRAAGADMSAVMAALGIYASKLDIKVRLERFCTSVDDLMELANLLSYLGETKQNGEKITKQRGPSVFVVKKTAADIPISKLKTLPASFFLAVAGAATSMSQYIMSNMQAGTFNAADSPAVKDAVKTRKPRNLPLFWVNVEVRSKAVPIADNGFDAVQDLATQYWTDPKINPLLMTAQSTGAFSTRVKEIFKKPLVSDMITLAQIRAVHGVRDLVETNALTIIRQSLVPELIERLQAEMYGSSIEELEGQYKIGSDPPNTSRRMTDLWSAVDNCGNPMIPTDRRAFQFPNPIRFR